LLDSSGGWSVPDEHQALATLRLIESCRHYTILKNRRFSRLFTGGARILAACGFLLLIAGFGAHLHYIRIGAAYSPIMPVGENILTQFGIGPIVLRDVFYLNMNAPPALPAWFWIAVTALSLSGAGLLILRLAAISTESVHKSVKQSILIHDDAVRSFLILSVLLYLAAAILTNPLFDEYLVPLVPLLAAGLVPNDTSLSSSDRIVPRRVLSGALIFAFAVFAVCGTHDYLMLNRVRWRALETLQHELHVGPEDIDGGYEFNGWYLYDPKHVLKFTLRRDQVSWWWVRRDTYQIGLGPIPGYTVIKEYDYGNWMPPHAQKVVVLHKKGSTPR
jgi:hypothetical protein